MKFFITGGSGLLGRHIIPLIRERSHEAIAPPHSKFDITFTPQRTIDCDIFLSLAGYTDIAAAERNNIQAETINNYSLCWIPHKFRDSTQIYHISTDYVYDGFTHLSKETDLLAPWCAYGRSKAAGDTRLLSVSKSNIHIIRTSFKPVQWPHPVAFTNVFTNADTVDIIAKMILDFVLVNPPGGVYNIGTRRKSVYGLAKKNNPDIRPLKWTEEQYPTLRPELSMDLFKYRAVMSDKQ